MKYDIFLGFGLFDPDIFGSEFICTDEDMYFTTELCQIEGFRDSRIPTSDESDTEILEEVPITRSTV